MIYGDQWTCSHCEWANLFVRTKCRNCTSPRPADATVHPFDYPTIVEAPTRTKQP